MESQINLRLELLQKLGMKCVICGESDTRIIHIDHKLGQGYLEKEYFEKKEDMLQFYLDNFKTESKYLQPLCFNCNTKKRIENKEQRGRPSLTEYFKIVMDMNPTHEERTKIIYEFLHSNPQFIPINDRYVPIFLELLQVVKAQKAYEEKKKQFDAKYANALPDKAFGIFLSHNSIDLSSKTEESKSYTSLAVYEELSPQIYEFIKDKEGNSKTSVGFTIIHAEFIDKGPWSLNQIKQTMQRLLNESKIIPAGYNAFNTK